MLAHLYAPKYAQNQHLQAFYSLTSKPFEVLKMQTTHSAHPAQHHSHQSNGLFLVCLLSLGAFLFHSIQSHLVTDAFVSIMSLFFDKFSVKSSSSLADIALLTVLLLALFGLYTAIKEHFLIAVFAVILAVLAFAFGG